MDNNELMTEMAKLAIRLGIIIIAVRLCGRLGKKAGLTPLPGQLLAGFLIGPYALGGISLPGFPGGIFANLSSGSFSQNTGLLVFAIIGAVVFFFMLGLETNIALFLRYSIAGSVISIGGTAVSFVLGDLAGAMLLHLPVISPQCLFLGSISTVTSTGITAMILHNRKKIDSPEGVTILSAAVFDDMAGLFVLKLVLIVCIILIGGESGEGETGITNIIIKTIAVWIGITVLGMIFSRKIEWILRGFKRPYDFPVLALGIALLLAGIFDMEGSSMIIGAYITGLFLSKTEIAAEIRDRIYGIYHFFVPILFAAAGMMADIKILFSAPVLALAAVLSIGAVLAKIIGCGAPAFLLGFNVKGSLRIGTGMAPRGEVALIIAGTGLILGILDSGLYNAIFLMTIITTIIAIPLVNISLGIRGNGTQRQVKGGDSAEAVWNFPSGQITNMVAANLLDNLRKQKFYIQTLNIDDGLSQARRNDMALSVTENEKSLNIETAAADMPYVKTMVHETIGKLLESVQKMKELSENQVTGAVLEERKLTNADLVSYISPDCISAALRGETKNEIITELVDLLNSRGKLYNRDQVLNDVFEREKIMSTGMQHGIALPHAKTDGVSSMAVAVGIKKDGINFGSADGTKSRIFIMVISPKRISGPHIQFMSLISAILRDEKIREDLAGAATPAEAAAILRGSGG